jgi:hypothetical protein
MRTTLTLDDDLARVLSDEAHRTRRPFKRVVNDALRRGLARAGEGKTSGARYRVVPHDAGELNAGLDPARMNQLVDELEIEASAVVMPTRAGARRGGGRR